jgi:Pyruvate/2-oxoacid:ferredoxin oxidoreductase delta subunit
MIFVSSLRRVSLSPSTSPSLSSLSSLSSISRSLSLFISPTTSTTLTRMKCKSCQAVCPKQTVQANTANRGREFYSCSKASTGCKFFAWGDGKPSLNKTRPLSTSSSSSSTGQSSVPLANTLVIYTDGGCLGTLRERNVISDRLRLRITSLTWYRE